MTLDREVLALIAAYRETAHEHQQIVGGCDRCRIQRELSRSLLGWAAANGDGALETVLVAATTLSKASSP